MSDASYECANAIETLWRVSNGDCKSAGLIQKSVHDPELYWAMVINCGVYLLNLLDVMAHDKSIITPDGYHLSTKDEIVTELRQQLTAKGTDTTEA